MITTIKRVTLLLFFIQRLALTAVKIRRGKVTLDSAQANINTDLTIAIHVLAKLFSSTPEGIAVSLNRKAAEAGNSIRVAVDGAGRAKVVYADD